MSIDKQKNIWNKNWQGQINVNPQIILNSHFTLEAYHYLKKFINTNSKSQKILEAGCGTGRFCCLIANDYSYSKVIGMDLSQNSISISNSLKEYLKVPNVFFVKGNLFQIPYPNNYFDIVGNEGVIEHYKLESHPNYIDALREMVRVTNKGGKIIIAVPSWLNLPHTCYKWILNRLGKRFEYGSEK